MTLVPSSLTVFMVKLVLASVFLIVTVSSLGAQDVPRRPAPGESLEFQHLEGQDYSKANFRNAELTMTRFQGANLSGADFTNAKMDRTELDDANLSHAIGLGSVDFGLGVSAQRANFQHADLRNARITGTYFEGADFRHADLSGAFLRGRFHDALFEGAKVQDAVLLGAGGIESQRGDLRSRGALVNADDFAQAVARGRDFSGCNLRGFQLQNANVDGGRFHDANFHSANLNGASFQRADLSEALLNFAKLEGGHFVDANLSQAKLNGTESSNVDLSRANLRGASLRAANLRNAQMHAADLTGADLSGADLTGADLSAAILDGVQWDAAIIAEVKGITKSRQSELKSNAGRWKHDLSQGFGNFMRSFSVPMWLLCWIAGGIVLIRGWRRTAGHLSLKLMTGMHVLAGLPALAFVLLILCGTSPTAQLSGNPDGWSRWVHIWASLFSFGRLIVIGYVPLLIVAWIVYFKRRVPGVVGSLAISAVLTGLTLLFASGVLMLLAPTA